jgi:hypothetical protein
MRYRIVPAYVICGVALGIILLQVARPGTAAQTAGPDTIPADCRDMPLPSALPFAVWGATPPGRLACASI